MFIHAVVIISLLLLHRVHPFDPATNLLSYQAGAGPIRDVQEAPPEDAELLQISGVRSRLSRSYVRWRPLWKGAFLSKRNRKRLSLRLLQALAGVSGRGMVQRRKEPAHPGRPGNGGLSDWGK